MDEWDFYTLDNSLKCKVYTKDDLKYNIIYQSSFNPFEPEVFQKVMEDCFSKFYSNDYKMIIIEDYNSGGDSDLCVPFTKYANPKIDLSLFVRMKSTNLTEHYFNDNPFLNPETCYPYTKKGNIMEGETVKYSDVNHKITKSVEFTNILSKKLTEKKRKEYLKTGKTKKPTEIIIFTDGYSFSCASILIKSLQMKGGAITVGYFSRPDLVKSKYDASQSNSGVSGFDFTEQMKSLVKLHFTGSITYNEVFDPNDKSDPKVATEFKIYPVDEVSNIYALFSDDKLDRFVSEADSIFKKYNDLENGNCNPDNKYLYFETEECDSLINVEHAHGGYLCGSDGKWNKKKCIAGYCDDGYILNNERTQCIKDPCENITLNEISITEVGNKTFNIEPNNIYLFTIDNDDENITYSFDSDTHPLLYAYDGLNDLEDINDTFTFKKNDKIFCNLFVNNTENITIKIKSYNNDSDSDDDDHKNSTDNTTNNAFFTFQKKKRGLSAGTIIAIIASILGALIILFTTIIICNKNQGTNLGLTNNSEKNMVIKNV